MTGAIPARTVAGQDATRLQRAAPDGRRLLSVHNPSSMHAQPWLTGLIAAATIAGVALGRFPGLRMNRATIALVGATLLLVTGCLSLDEAFTAVDLPTLALLLGMMVLNANLRIAGFFEWVVAQVAAAPRTPWQLLAAIVGVAGVLSAFLLNDTVVLLMTPLVIELVRAGKRQPAPYLVALATSANLGSVATIIGNPQNMLIGMASGIGFVAFSRRLAPVAAGGLVITWAVIALVYRRELSTPWSVPPPRPHRTRPFRPLLWKSGLAFCLLLVAMVTGMPLPLAALGAAAFLLVTRRLKPERVFREVDWSLLVLFSGLFVVTRSLEVAGISRRLFDLARPLLGGADTGLTTAAAVLSNLVSNVPAVLLLEPMVPELPDPAHAWLILSMATTLAGNLTLLGSVANLIVAENARAHRVELTFREYLKAGVPVTLLSLAWGCVWL